MRWLRSSTGHSKLAPAFCWHWCCRYAACNAWDAVAWQAVVYLDLAEPFASATATVRLRRIRPKLIVHNLFARAAAAFSRVQTMHPKTQALCCALLSDTPIGGHAKPCGPGSLAFSEWDPIFCCSPCGSPRSLGPKCACFCAWAKGSFWCKRHSVSPQCIFANFAVLLNQDEDEKATLPDPKATLPDQKARFADHVLARF